LAEHLKILFLLIQFSGLFKGSEGVTGWRARPGIDCIREIRGDNKPEDLTAVNINIVVLLVVTPSL
jgi:hypothetical protein